MASFEFNGVGVNWNVSYWDPNGLTLSIGTYKITWAGPITVKWYFRETGTTTWSQPYLIQHYFYNFTGVTSEISGTIGAGGNAHMLFTDAAKGKYFDLSIRCWTSLPVTGPPNHDEIILKAIFPGNPADYTTVAGYVRDAETGLTVTTGGVTHVESGESIVISVEGRYVFGPFPYFDIQNFTATVPNYNPLTLSHFVEKGVANTLDFNLGKPVPPPPAEPPPVPEPEPGTGTFYVKVFDATTADAVITASVAADSRATHTDAAGWATFTDMTMPSTITYFGSAPDYQSSATYDFDFSADNFIALTTL